jgi:hypothetical protein
MLYNMLCVLFTPLATIFWGSDIPTAQERPPVSESGPVTMISSQYVTVMVRGGLHVGE